MADEAENLINKLREIEEQCAHALTEIPHGLTHSRVRHISTLAKFIRMRLDGQTIAAVEPMREDAQQLPSGKRPN